ncbi:hypothetical protein M569_17508, partial [Genlisea aurea]
QLVLIPWPVMGHVQIIDFAKLILRRRHLHLLSGKSVSITVLLMKLPGYIDKVSSSFVDKLSSAGESLRFIHLPPVAPTQEWSSRTRGFFTHSLVLSQRSNVADFLQQHKASTAAVVIDMLCTSMIGVAEDLNLPAYIFFTSPASFLGAMLHFQALQDEGNTDVSELGNSETNLLIPSFSIPVPPKALPQVVVEKTMWETRFLQYARDYRKAKGIIVNTLYELEPFALNSFSNKSAYVGGVPPVFAVGPILSQPPNLNLQDESTTEMLQWLDRQPTKSVVFVCFGSQGSLEKHQIQELGKALERSGYRFLWSLRRRPERSEQASFPIEYTRDEMEKVLADGFSARTAEMGRVRGWVPQQEVLSNAAVGGFVSHCGWNSVLESLWYGVPMATWPLHAEQHMNAFQLARELGLAEEISLECRERVNARSEELITAEEIVKGIEKMMNPNGEVRKAVEGMKEKCRMAVQGSSYVSLAKFFQTLMK